jgi:exopolysaccharide biosynthesis polyprenyl glycosylphosphotransferase
MSCRRAFSRPIGWVGVDAATVSLAAVATAVAGGVADGRRPSAGWAAAFAGASLLAYAARGLYQVRLRMDLLDQARRIVVGTTVAAAFVIAARALLTGAGVGSGESIREWAFACAFVAAGRLAVCRLTSAGSSAPELLRRTLIVGAGRIGRLVAKRLLDAPEFGLRPIAFLDKEPLVDASPDLDLPIVGASWDLDEAVKQFDVQQVIVTFSTAPSDVLLRVIRRCDELGIDVSVVPRLFERMPKRYMVEHIGGIPLVSPGRPDPHAWQFAVKYAADRLIAGMLLLLVAPLLLAITAAVLVSSGPPVLFRQTRVCRDGRRFQMLKFRSMRGANDPGLLLRTAFGDLLGPGGIEGEDRRTRVGVFLRKTSLDELPQLLNVLKGEMSLVGPRPERPEYVSVFQRRVYRYGDRHRVKSGITGWAQIHGLRGRTSVTDRVEWDNYYIENFSLWLDLEIALKTVRVLCRSLRRSPSRERLNVEPVAVGWDDPPALLPLVRQRPPRPSGSG